MDKILPQNIAKKDLFRFDEKIARNIPQHEIKKINESLYGKYDLVIKYRPDLNIVSDNVFSEDITKNVKRAVQMMNPEIKNTNKQLFGDMWQDFELDQSNRVFFSTANTKIQPGDQSAFGQYLYGYMPSAKESNPDGNMQRFADAYRYTLY